MAPRLMCRPPPLTEMKRLGAGLVYLDISRQTRLPFTKPPAFPMIYEELLGLKLSRTQEPDTH